MKDMTGIVGLLKPLLITGLLLLVSVCQTTVAAVDAHEVTVPVLRVGTDYFTNATVTAQSATHVTVNYSRGMMVAKMGDLDPDVQRQLGLDPGLTKDPNATGTNATLFGKLNKWANGFVAGMKQALADRETKGPPLSRAPEAKSSPYSFENPTWGEKLIGLSIVGAIFILYFLFCNACRHLCRRAGTPSNFLVWIPGWKRLALYRAT